MNFALIALPKAVVNLVVAPAALEEMVRCCSDPEHYPHLDRRPQLQSGELSRTNRAKIRSVNCLQRIHVPGIHSTLRYHLQVPNLGGVYPFYKYNHTSNLCILLSSITTAHHGKVAATA